MEMMPKYLNLWSERLETSKAANHTIASKRGAGCVYQHFHRPRKRSLKVHCELIDKQLEVEVIQPSQSNERSPLCWSIERMAFVGFL